MSVRFRSESVFDFSRNTQGASSRCWPWARLRQPRPICLDEAPMGLCPVITQQVFDTIVRINEAGVTVFMVEQNALMALGISNRGGVRQDSPD
ncbi:MAG: hypothetical protein ACM3X4_02235 [Ignavibacteriales bacterium]